MQGTEPLQTCPQLLAANKEATFHTSRQGITKAKTFFRGKSFSLPGKLLGNLMDSGEPLASSCQSFPLMLNPGCTYLGLSDCMGRLNLRGGKD